MGGALGLAILSTIATSRAHATAGPAALTNGYSLAFLVGAGFTVAGAIAAFTLMQPRPVVAVGRDIEAAEREPERLAA